MSNQFNSLSYEEVQPYVSQYSREAYQQHQYEYNSGRIPESKERLLIVISSLMRLLSAYQRYAHDTGEPKISTIARDIEMDGFGQKYDNLRVRLKQAEKARCGFIKANQG